MAEAGRSIAGRRPAMIDREDTQEDSATRHLLFEIGVEELPAGYVPPALEQLERGVREGLEALRLGLGGIVTYGTPRRLAVLVHRVGERQTDLDEEAMGPAARVAFDAEGRPTRAL